MCGDHLTRGATLSHPIPHSSPTSPLQPSKPIPYQQRERQRKNKLAVICDEMFPDLVRVMTLKLSRDFLPDLEEPPTLL